MALSKEELRAAAEALFKDIDSEFGKKKKEAAKSAKPLPVVKKEISEGVEANRIAELMSKSSPWKPVAVVTHLVTQVCTCCRGETEYIGNTLIRHEHKTHKIIWDHVIPEMPEHSSLPRTIQDHRQMVEQCPTCVRFNMFQVDVKSLNLQLTLFH